MANNTAFTQTGNTGGTDAPQVKVGRVTMPATAITAADYLVQSVGFTPRYVLWDNNTSRIKLEWYEGMAADTCLKTAAAGTRTIETTNKGITICDADGTANANGRCFKVAQNATLLGIAASDVINWVAEG
jgi:hypothetical protein